MLLNVLLLLILCSWGQSDDNEDTPVLYYYGLEESERSLPHCGPRQACSALLQRYWRAPALVRLCRCPHGKRCDTVAPTRSRLEINNRAFLQFCQPIDWPECSVNEEALTVVTSYERMNPDEIKEKHHANVQLTPPELNFKCRCKEPNHWKLAARKDNGVRKYQCSYLPLCKTEEFCGNFNFDLNALYQSCACPKHHICVHNGGLPYTHISELLYEGSGWKAYCQRQGEVESYEDY